MRACRVICARRARCLHGQPCLMRLFRNAHEGVRPTRRWSSSSSSRFPSIFLSSSLSLKPRTMDLNLTDIHVLITGAAGGIGISTVREFLRHGALVTAQYRSSRASLDAAFPNEIKEGRVQCLAADVRHEEDVKKLFVEAEQGMAKPVAVLISTSSPSTHNIPDVSSSQSRNLRIHTGTTTRNVPRAMEQDPRDEPDWRVPRRQAVSQAVGRGEGEGRRGE